MCLWVLFGATRKDPLVGLFTRGVADHVKASVIFP